MRLVSSVASIHLDFFNLTYVYLIVQWQDSDIDELVIVLGYFIFLSILTVVKYREDPSVMPEERRGGQESGCATCKA